MNKKIFLPVIFALAILTVGTLATTASAEDVLYPPIVERLAERFGLNEDEVRGVFEEVHDEKTAEMYASFVERLDDLVAEGVLSREQKDALVSKHEEMQAKMDDLRTQNISKEEKRQKIKALRSELWDWAQEQGIDLSAVRPLGQNFGWGKTRGMWMGMPH
jgi:hypothetical protein